MMKRQINTQLRRIWILMAGAILASTIYLAPNELTDSIRGALSFLPVAGLNEFVPSSVVAPIAVAWILFFPSVYLHHYCERQNIANHLERWRLNQYGALAVWLMLSMLSIPGFFIVLYLGDACNGLFCLKERSISLLIYCLGLSQLYSYVSALAIISIKYLNVKTS